MNKKSIFTQIILLVVVIIVCVILTVTTALLLGSVDTDIFDFSNLNFANVIPALIIGGIISCLVVGVVILFIARSAFFRAKDYFNKKKDNGGNEK